MKFGKLASIEGVDFSLPDLAYADHRGLSGQPPKHLEAYVGLPRWGSKDWVGEIYPKGAKPHEYLGYYAQSFNSIELNSTHYRSPTSDLVRQWYQASQPGFLFCPKVPQVISHYRKLVDCREELLRFAEAIADFEDRLGHSFLQLHDSFGPPLLDHLRRFLDLWPKELPLAIEFRHPAWFSGHLLLPELSDLLMAHRVAPVITDVAGRRDVLHQSLTAPTVMLRLVGNGMHPSDLTRAQAWLNRLSAWQNQGLERAYLFAHQPGDIQAVQYGSYLIQGLNTQLDQTLVVPGIPPKDGTQMSLF